MAEYESIHGTRVKYLSSDPTLNSSLEGQVWYNSTSGTNKALVQIKAWGTSASMATARRESGAAGTQTASVVFGGGLPPSGNPDSNATEEYNGFGYTTGGALNTAREGMGAAGTLTAALGFGGATYPSPGVRNVTEGYDGSSWTSLNNLQSNRSYVQGFGTQTAALAVGGAPDSPVNLQTESWDGTNWTNLPAPSNVPVGILTGGSAGTQTAGVTFGGSNVNNSPPGVQATTLDWNGSIWTAGSNMNTARRRPGGAGTSTAALGFGGYLPSPYSTATEEYDGNTWTNSTSMPTATAMMHGSGSMYAALSSGGRTSTAFTGATYEYNSNINAITISVFSSGGNRNDGQNDGCGAGTLNAGLAFGGNRNPASPNTGGLATQTQSEEYNGSSWSEGGAMSQGRATFGGLGTQTAALAFGGRATNNPFTYTNATEEYGGSSWTSGGNLGSTAYYMNRSGGGTQTAGVSVGGINNIPGTANEQRTEEYDGSSWTTVNNMLANSRKTVYLGTQTAGLIASGGPPAPGNVAAYNYDGTNWTAAGVSIVNALSDRVGIGTASAGLIVGGSPYTPAASNSELWNGTAFANDATIATQRGSSQSSNSATGPVAGYITSGSNPTTPGSALTSTEVYTESSSTTTASTLTTS